MKSYEDNYRLIGELVYREIQNLLGGNCQAAVLALDVARRTTEDKIPPHTLILMEWTFSNGRYDDRTLLLYGKESSTAEWFTGDIQKQFWRDDFPEFNVGVIAGTPSEFFCQKILVHWQDTF